MTRIKRLPDTVVDQIKAGEVVERPASVVKELVENALDAQATDIHVELMDGGRQLIRITDNGTGMDETDLVASLERHATSKLSRVEDLEAIGSFGFRGEALPSIAAVSRLTVRSRQSVDPLGHEIGVEGGVRETKTRSVSMAPGTVITVRDLFCQVPARLKFLKSNATEYSHVADYLTALALAYPRVGFRLTHNGRESFHVPPHGSLAQRFEALLGAEARDFVEVAFERGSFQVQGFAGYPEVARSLPKTFLTFVNGRLVKDKVVRAGVLQGYTGLVMKGLVPPVVLFLSVDPAWVDVNAHPAKTEIRFHDPAAIQDLVTIALQNAIKDAVQKRMLRDGERTAPSPTTSSRMTPSPTTPSRTTPTPMMPSRAVVPQDPASGPSPLRAGTIEGRVRPSPRESTGWQMTPERSVPQHAGPAALFEASPVAQVVSAPSIEISPTRGVASPLLGARYLGQLLKCYLLFETVGGEFLVVDQHAFHERVLFEDLMREFKEAGVPREELITPILVPLPRHAAGVVVDERERLARLGFRVEALTDGRVALHSSPSFVTPSRAASVFDEVVVRALALSEHSSTQVHPLDERALEIRQEWARQGVHASSLSPEAVYHLYFATVACHSAVRAGEPLNEELVRRLLLRSESVDFFAHCPHGRPVFKRFGAREVGQWFERL